MIFNAKELKAHIVLIDLIRHFSVTADLRICKVYHTLDLRYLRGAISAV